MDKVFDRLFSLLERFMLPIVLVVGFMLYNKFSSFFTGREKDNEKAEEAQAEHNTNLSAPYKKAPANASPTQKRKIAIENGETAKKFKQALNAERIHKATMFGFSFTRASDLMTVAGQMKAHKVSLAGTAAEYKKVTGVDMYKDLRVALGSDYNKWLIIAGSTP